jgi:hypothetical protein
MKKNPKTYQYGLTKTELLKIFKHHDVILSEKNLAHGAKSVNPCDGSRRTIKTTIQKSRKNSK